MSLSYLGEASLLVRGAALVGDGEELMLQGVPQPAVGGLSQPHDRADVLLHDGQLDDALLQRLDRHGRLA